jgi:hypothetical protein
LHLPRTAADAARYQPFPAISPAYREGRKCLTYSNLIDRQAPTVDPARIAAIIASDSRFEYFGPEGDGNCRSLRVI